MAISLAWEMFVMRKGRPPGTKHGEVLRMLSRGFSNKEIAAKLNVRPRTVRYYVAFLMRKAGLSGSADHRRLVLWAAKKKI